MGFVINTRERNQSESIKQNTIEGNQNKRLDDQLYKNPPDWLLLLCLCLHVAS